MATMSLAFMLETDHLCLADALKNNIAEATERATEFLISRQKNGVWQEYRAHQLGETSLVGLSLVHANKNKTTAVRSAEQQVRRYLSSNSDTYDVSLAIMFLDSLEKKQDLYLLRDAGNRIGNGQLKNGAWSYGIPGPGRVDYRNTLSGGDNSCTQFAVMGSWIARRHGTQNEECLKRVDTYFRNSVDANTGGWAYSANGGSPTASMTCAGLLALAARKGVDSLPSNRKKRAVHKKPQDNSSKNKTATTDRETPVEPIDPVVQRAFAYLGEQLRAHPNELSRDYYFLWSLERVGVIYGVRTIGGVDWYAWGAKHLIDDQRPDGSWQAAYPATIDTSFAVLFLTRANMANDLTAKLQGSGDSAMPQGTGGGNQFIKRLSESSTQDPTQSKTIPRQPKM